MWAKVLFFLLLSLLVFAYAEDDDSAVGTTPKPIKSGTVSERTRIFNHIFGNYDKRVNPDNCTVKFGIALINIGVREERNILDSYVWLRYVWNDERLQWKPEEYGGTDVLRVPADQVWKPDLTMYNSADAVNRVNCWQSNVLVYPDGEVLWVPPCKFSSQCNFTLKKSPYGKQTCSLKFGSWTADGNILDLQFYNNDTTLDLADMDNTSNFEVVSTNGERHVRYCSCCAEPYQDVTFNVTIQRILGEELFKKL